MKPSSAAAGAPAGSPRKGEINAQTIPHLFHQIGVAGKTGTLTVVDREIHKSIEFVKGTVLFASSSDRDDRLNHTLLRAGVVSLPNLLRALEVALATRDRLGEVMVRLKMLSAEEVEKWVRHQVREIALGIFDWTRGQISFEEKPATDEAITLGVPGDVLVIEGVRRIGSWARVYEEVGGINTEYLATRDMPAITRGLPLSAGEKALIDMCATPTALGEMCDASALPDIDVCKAVWALLIVGALMKS